MRFGSLFAGIGGFDLGLERAGMECVWQVEVEPWCQRVLAKHWPNVKRYGDIREIKDGEIEAVDLICGGFPCQDISHSGHMRGISTETRSGLWFEFARIVRLLRPRYVLVENVAALLDGGICVVLGGLAEIGFDAEWECIPAAAVGAPHIRDRVWLLAYPRRQFGDANGGADRRPFVFPSRGTGGGKAERSAHRELVEMVPGIHPRVAQDWWRSQSRVDRSTHGIPHRMDRLKGTGNAVCPDAVEWIGRRILESEAV